ncbi:BON domain-containing protein [Actinoplanes sp. NBC_00393]|uniref:BON domain-containing protein n=1 Tax=Actinoplanes sp. NBC_00393 TaxID=2975953 RepID=UPI002E2427AB
MDDYSDGEDDWEEFDDCSRSLSTDDMIAEVFAASLHGDPHIVGARMRVQVQNRVVILLGSVASVQAHGAMRQRAWDIPGVVDVCNRLSVTPPGDSQTSGPAQ